MICIPRTPEGRARLQRDIDEKIRQTKDRLIKLYGYNEQSATDVLDHVAAKYAKGEYDE